MSRLPERQTRLRTGRPLYYGWVLVGVLSVTVTVSYGVLMYAFAVVLEPMQTDLGWSQAALTGGFSIAAMSAGIAAIPVGRWVDRYGPRAVMTTGSILATLLLIAWSRVTDPLTYQLIWLGLGACMAAVFYEPAFTVIATWFRRDRARALTMLTVAGGLASTIFVPLTAWLVSVAGWRAAVVWLALILATLTILPHALVLRRRPSDHGLERDGLSHTPAPGPVAERCGVPAADERVVPATIAFRSVSFRWLAAAFFLSTVANYAIAVHLFAIMSERGYAPAAAATALAMLGLAKLPGRVLMEPLVRRVSTASATVLVFAVQAIALLAMLMLPGAAGMWVFIALFGAGDGASTPARAAIVADLFGSSEYGTVGGVLAFFVAGGRAAAPIGASLACAALGGYDAVVWILAAIVLAAALAMARAGARPAETQAGDASASFSAAVRLPV